MSSYLLGDAYASSSSSSSDSEEEHAESSESTVGPVAECVEAADGDLLSVDAVFAATTATFRSPVPSASSKIRVFDNLKKTADEDSVEATTSTQTPEPTGTVMQPKPRKRLAETQSAPVTGMSNSHKREKTSAKDRVKNQRQRGQAGIGSDFRSWKSETEMAMRQQYD